MFVSALRGAGAGLVCALGATTLHANLEEARSLLTEWSRVQTLISKESTLWEEEKTTLEDTIETAEAELSLLDEKIAELESSSTEAEKQKAEIATKIETAKSTSGALTEKLATAETEVWGLIGYLPDSLKDGIAPFIQRLPKTGDESSLPLAQRIQTVVGILAQVEKFQSNLTLVSEIKEVGGTQAAEVKTLYYGLAMAYYADATGSRAGYGYPTAEGWQWTPAEGDLATRITRAIAIHENTAEPAFVTLPVEIN